MNDKIKNVATMESLELHSVHDVRATAQAISGMIDRGVALGDLGQCHRERDLCVKALRMAHAGFFPFFVKNHGEQMLSNMIRACEDRMQGLTQLATAEEETLDMTEEVHARVSAGLWGGGGL